MEIKQSIVDFFKSKFPNVQIGNILWAEGRVTDEFKKMDIGDITLFDVRKYKVPTVKSTPSSALLELRMKESREWTTRNDFDNKAIAVFRSK